MSVLADASGEVFTLNRLGFELSRDGAAGAVLPLVRACGDPDEGVREFASAALEALGPPPPDVASQLAEQLKHLQPGLRVLLVSGHRSHPSLRDLDLPPGAAFLAKPFTLGDLTAKVRELLAVKAS